MTQRLVSLALVLSACGGGAQFVQPESPPEPPPEAVLEDKPARPADEEMANHFWDVAAARDAVIRANLEGIRTPLLRVAEGQYGDDMPLDWQSWIEEMQTEARLASRVTSLDAAAESVARLSGTCADCHQATNAGPELAERPSMVEAAAAVEGLSARMAEHMAASQALWEGLTAPSYQAWIRGAEGLAALPLPDANEADAGPDMADDLEAIRALGEKAKAARTAEDRVQVYSEILHQCANCHADHAGG